VAAVAAMLGVLIFDTLPGLFIGISVSLLLYRASRPHAAVLGRVPGTTDQFADVERSAANTPSPGIAVVRVDGGLFFANADAMRSAVLSEVTDTTHAVVLDAETMPYIDVTAASMLVQLTEELERRGVKLVIARDIGQVRDVLETAPETVKARAYPTVQAAVEDLSR
jgi:SulP family sulfate permease